MSWTQSPTFSGSDTGADCQVIAAFLPTGTPALVQSRATVNTAAPVFSSPVTAGNLLVVVLGTENSDVAGAAATDTVGSTWHTAISQTGGPTCIKMFYAIAGGSGANQVFLTGYTHAFSNAAIMEISGAQAALDGTPTGQNGTTTPGSITGSNDNSAVVVGLDGFHSDTTWNPPASYQLTQANGSDAVGIAFALAVGVTDLVSLTRISLQALTGTLGDANLTRISRQTLAASSQVNLTGIRIQMIGSKGGFNLPGTFSGVWSKGIGGGQL
jgi:hypothetical protein